MSDDSETVEDTEKGSLAEVTDDSCTVEFIEILPVDRASDDYHTPEFIDEGLEVMPEDLQEIKQEPADEYDDEEPNYSVKQEPADESDDGDPHDSFKRELADEYETDGQCFTVPAQVRTTAHI